MARRIAALWVWALVIAAGTAPVGAGAGDEARGLAGHNIRVTMDPAAQFGAAAAYNHLSSEYLVVWEDHRDLATRDADIWGRWVASDGTRIGSDFRISGPAATGIAEAPDVAFDGCTGTFLVVWSDWRNYPTRGADVYGQRIAGDGTFLGANFRVSGGNAIADEFTPAVTSGPGDQFHVVWTDTRHAEWSIYARRIPSDPLESPSTNVRVSGPVTSMKTTADVAYDPYGDVLLVAWEDDRNEATTGWDVYGQVVSVTTGNPIRVGPNRKLTLSAADADDWGPSVAELPGGGGFLAVWNDGRRGPGEDREVFGQRVSATGARIGGNVRISGSASGTVSTAWVDATLAGGTPQWLVAWADDRNDLTRGFDVYGQRLGTGGGRLGNNFRVSGNAAVEDDLGVNGIAGPLGEYLVVWTDHRRYATHDTDVYGQRVTAP